MSRSFLVALPAVALAVVAACQLEIITLTPNGAGCPGAEPEVGAACGSEMTCGYAGSGGCGNALTCLGGVWQPDQGSCSGSSGSSGSPAPCPTKLPTVGAPCKSPGQACTITFPGACAGMFAVTCGAAGWAVEDESPACMPPACPDAEPDAGAACDASASCTYTVTPQGCPPETQNASCVGGAWEIETPTPCSP